MIYLLIGRFASGRKYLANILKERIEPDEKPNETVLSVLTETETIIQNNILIIPPDRLNVITASDPTEAFEIIHAEADDMDRKLNYVKRAEKKIKAEKEFDSIDENEDAIFCEFEDIMHKMLHDNIFSDIPTNVTRCYHYVNEFSPTTTNTYADEIIMNHNLNKKTAEIVIELNNAGLLQEKRDDNLIRTIKADKTESAVNATFFAELLIDDSKSFADVMKRWLMYKAIAPKNQN